MSQSTKLIFTHDNREKMIYTAVNSIKERGNTGFYQFKNKPVCDNIVDDRRKNLVTYALAETIYTKNPKYKKIAYEFNDRLERLIQQDDFLKMHRKDIIILVKGNNAYKLLVEDDTENPWSDMDIVININYRLHNELFYALKERLTKLVQLVISQYKRSLDNMFCHINNNKIDTVFLSIDTINQFKKDYQESLNQINQKLFDDNITDVSFKIPFPIDNDVTIRNKSSKNSQIILKNEVMKNYNSIIEIPHFTYCETIPLSRTPIFATSNFTINFKRDTEGEFIGNFDLHRIRINNLMEYTDSSGVSRGECIASDFIDVVINNHDDSELIELWKNPRYYTYPVDIPNPQYPGQSYAVSIPNKKLLYNDLLKMTKIYQCPESKKEKREKKLKVLSEMV